MKKKSTNYSFALTMALLPLMRYIGNHHSTLFTLLCAAVCLFFLLRGLYYHLMERESGRAFLRKFPLLKIPEETEEIES